MSDLSDVGETWEAEAAWDEEEQSPPPKKQTAAPPQKQSISTPSAAEEPAPHVPGPRAMPAGKKKKGAAKPEVTGPLRSPILCIMGHVDSGKTKLLDKMRKSNVQDREAGGITQQIGATFFPRENLLQMCARVDSKLDLKVPGLLLIDTPGHASFNNLRLRGSSLCDLAILVIDITKGLQPQTRESLDMLRQRKCPFVIALNKLDRIYDWNPKNGSPCLDALNAQKKNVRETFNDQANKVILQLTEEQGLNCYLYWNNENVRKYVSVIPTSAHTGEGIPDLLTLIVKLTQELMAANIQLDEVNNVTTVLEVKNVEGLGTTIDVILVSGILKEGDTIVVCGLNGPIVTTIRALLTPQPLKEMRVKGEYIHHKVLHAAMGIKIAAPDLEGAVAGTSLLVAKNPNDREEIERLKRDVQEDMSAIFRTVDKTQEGVYVVASTLGSLEALLDFLKENKIPVAGINIGTVFKLDVKKASTMRDRNRPEYSIIMAFDVKIDPDAQIEAKKLGVTIFAADIIYHLCDSFTKHLEEWRDSQRRLKLGEVVFPCSLKIIPDCIFNKKDPLVLGVKVEDGELRVGTPLVVVDKDQIIKLGNVESIEHNKKSVQTATIGQDVAIKITGEPTITYGKHFNQNHKVVSYISRASINIMKEHFVPDLKKHAHLVMRLKAMLRIP